MAESSAIHAGEGSERAQSRALFRQPLALQWFENGKLVKRDEHERQAGRFELFLDLLYVAILANFAENLAEHASGSGVLKYILIFTTAWHIWSDLREIMNSFYNDDLGQRILILWVMACLVLFGNNATLVDEDIGALRATVGSYMVARLSCLAAHWVYSCSSYHHRRQQRLWVIGSLIGLVLYIPLFSSSISTRGKVAVAWVAIILEEAVLFFIFSPFSRRLLKVKYAIAVDIPHEVDRFAAFYIIVLGEFLYQIIVGSPTAIGFNTRYLRAVWTLIVAFCLNWLYVHGDGSINSSHALRHNFYASYSWALFHLPLVASLLAGGHAAALTATTEELHHPEVWLLCVGLGIGVICLWILALLHQDNDAPGTLILPKLGRLIFRPIIGIIIICLPLDHHISLTVVMSIIMALFAFTVIWENVTSLQKGAKFWEAWEGTEYPSDLIPHLEENTSNEHIHAGPAKRVGTT